MLGLTNQDLCPLSLPSQEATLGSLTIMPCPMPTTPMQAWLEVWTLWVLEVKCTGSPESHLMAHSLQGEWLMHQWATGLMVLIWPICHLRLGQGCVPHQGGWTGKLKNLLLPCMLLPTLSKTGKAWEVKGCPCTVRVLKQNVVCVHTCIVACTYVYIESSSEHSFYSLNTQTHTNVLVLKDLE